MVGQYLTEPVQFTFFARDRFACISSVSNDKNNFNKNLMRPEIRQVDYNWLEVTNIHLMDYEDFSSVYLHRSDFIYLIIRQPKFNAAKDLKDYNIVGVDGHYEDYSDPEWQETLKSYELSAGSEALVHHAPTNKNMWVRCLILYKQDVVRLEQDRIFYKPTKYCKEEIAIPYIEMITDSEDVYMIYVPFEYTE